MIRRRMHVIRRGDGTLAFHNAVPVDDATLSKLRAMGRGALLLVPAPSHTLDIAPFAEKLGLAVLCPRAIAGEVARKVKVTGHFEDLKPEPALRVVTLGGTTTGEAALLVTSPDGQRTHVITCDAVLNLPNSGGLAGLFMRFVGQATGGPRVGPFFKWKDVSDKAALRASLRALAQEPNLATLLPSHGTIIRGGVAAALEEAAAHLR